MNDKPMLTPVASDKLMMAFASAALILLTAVLYAFFFAVSRVRKNSRLRLLTYSVFAPLLGSVLVFSKTLNLDGLWMALAAAMLVGYLAAPYAIWKMCVRTHRDPTDPADPPEIKLGRQGDEP